MSTILSANVGRSVPTEHSGVPTTGIDKQPVDRIDVRAPGPKKGGLGSGVVGDAVDDRRHHGGDLQAVYAVAREELEWWASELGRDLRSGMFGENLTTAGVDVDGAVVGERWVIGEGDGAVVLEVAGPRIPCRTFAGHMGERGWVKRFTARGRTGAYLSVVVPGVIEPRMPVRVVDRPAHGLTVPDYFRAWMGDKDLARQLLKAGAVPEPHRGELAARLR